MTCVSCTRPLDPAEKTVTCGRPSCGKIFHPFCVDLNLTLWNALEAGIGLQWFCAGCRAKPAADLVARFEQLEAKVDAGFAGCRELLEVLVRKVDVRPVDPPVEESRLVHPSVAPEPKIESVTVRAEVMAEREKKEEQSGIFPDEIWVKIFRNLSGYQLSQARLTCRHWNQIIGRCSLMDKLEIRIPKGSILDKNCDEVRDLAASNSRYRRVVLEEVTIIKAALWWETIGKHVHTLNLKKCSMTAEDVLGILSNSPKLKSLTFDVKLSSSDPEIVIQDIKLEKLVLGESVQHETFAMFRKLCLPLKELSILHQKYTNEMSSQSLALVFSVQSSLKSLALYGERPTFLTDHLVRSLCLKRFQAAQVDNDFLKTFCEMQPAIDEMNVKFAPAVHFNAGVVPQGLTRMELTSDRYDCSPLVQTFPQLNLLIKEDRLYDSSKTLRFTHVPTVKNANLEILELIQPSDTVLNLAYFSNLRYLSIKRCMFESWNQFFTQCALLEHLEHLELSEIKTKVNCDIFFDYMENLGVLKLDSCDTMYDHFLKKLFTLCTNLHTISLKKMNGINDYKGVHLTMCEKLKRLKSLELYITNDILEHIIRYCSAIEKVQFDCYQISQEALQRLKAHRNLQLIRTYD